MRPRAAAAFESQAANSVTVEIAMPMLCPVRSQARDCILFAPGY
jgi:hypothetical protein